MKAIKQQIIQLGLILLLAYFSISIACTITPSLYVDVIQNSYDIRLSGLAENGWSTPDMGFHEPRIAPASVKVRIKHSGKINFFFNSEPAKVTAIEKGSMLTASSLFASLGTLSSPGVEINGKAAEPKFSEASKRNIGGKFETILLQPRFLLVLPTFSFAIVPVLMLGFLLLLISRFYDIKKFDFIPALVFACLAGFFLGQNRLDYWPRAFWIWGFTSLFLTGAILYRHFTPKISEAKNLGRNITALSIIAIVIFGFYIRFQGLDFGLPGLFHPDEGRKSKIIRSMVVTGDLNPHYFRHPNFLLYAGAFNNWLASFFIGKVPDPPLVVYLGRCTSAVLGSLSVLLIFLSGRLLFGNFAGLIAAAFLAVSPLHAVSSRYIKEDASMLFFTLACFYFAIKSLKNNCSIKYNFLSALCAGFSASSKFSGLLSIAFAMLPVYERVLILLQKLFPTKEALISKIRFEDYKINVGIGGVILVGFTAKLLFIVGFLIFTPYSILDYETFIYDFMGEKQHMQRGHTVPISAISYYWGYHLERSIFTWYQGFFAALSFAAIGYVLFKRKMYGVLAFCAVMLFYLPAEYVKAKPEPQPERYILPCLPFLALVLGDLISQVTAHSNRLIKYGLITLGGIALVQAGIYTYKHSQSIQYDTREQARNWILRNVPKGSKVIIDWQFYGPPGLDKYYQLLQLKDKNGAKLNRSLSPETLKESGYDYFVFSSLSYGRFLMTTHRSHNLSKRFKSMFNDMTPVKVFENNDYAFGFHNPELRIYKLK